MQKKNNHVVLDAFSIPNSSEDSSDESMCIWVLARGYTNTCTVGHNTSNKTIQHTILPSCNQNDKYSDSYGFCFPFFLKSC